MSEAQNPNPRKRQCTEQHQLPLPLLSKRQKLQHCSVKHIDTPAFWHSLSKIWLTKRALRELNRRNSLPRSPSRPARQVHQPITQNFLAKQRNAYRRVFAPDFLSHCSPSRVKDIKRFAQHGGPDLSDLIGARRPRRNRTPKLISVYLDFFPFLLLEES
jgi:hypothetical protein